MIPLYGDLSGNLNIDCYTPGRASNPILALICHNTAGPHDFNTVDAKTAQFYSDQAAAYLSNNVRQASAHYLVGAEPCGAPIYRIVPEKDTAYHAGGNPPTYPSRWQEPKTGKIYGGFSLNQVSIGIEVFGQVTDVLGPNQRAALFILVKDIVMRNTVLLDPLRTESHHEVEPGDRSDGVNWRDLARAWIAGGFNLTLPYNATLDTAGNIVVNGFVVGFGFRDYWISCAGADKSATISNDTIIRAARVFGLPRENEHVDADGKTRQKFERYQMVYDPKAVGDWQFSGAFIP